VSPEHVFVVGGIRISCTCEQLVIVLFLFQESIRASKSDEMSV
jgi:hypothetical protein